METDPAVAMRRNPLAVSHGSPVMPTGSSTLPSVVSSSSQAIPPASLGFQDQFMVQFNQLIFIPGRAFKIIFASLKFITKGQLVMD